MKLTREEKNLAKKEKIFLTALALLKTHGAQGLSMRAVADGAGMSLGNLQYHFKGKEELLAALLESFLNQYLSENWQASDNGLHNNSELEGVFYQILTHSSFDDCAVVFKELWALSQRNESLKEALVSYYQKIHEFLCELLRGNLRDKTEQITRTADILIPFFEGYCITKAALRSDPRKLAKDLAAVAQGICQREEK